MNISAVIPTYNRGYCIKRAINSVLDQTFPALEIVVVNDGSTDNTNEILKEYSGSISIISQENKGVSSARNVGIKNSRGDWIALLDSDDEWFPDKLKNQHNFYLRNSHLKIFQCEEIWIRNGVRVNPRNKHQKKGGWIFLDCLPLCIVSPSAVLFKKSLWQEINGFDEQFPVCEDYDLWLRIARKYEIGLDTVPGTIRHGGYDDQLSRSFKVIDEYRLMALEKHIFDPLLSNKLRGRVLIEALKKGEIILKGAEKRNKNPEKWQKKMEELEKLKSDLQKEI